MRVLQLPLCFAGEHYKLQRAALLSKAYVREGLFIEAHRILNSIDEEGLLPKELMRLRCAWSQLFREAGNPDEAARRLVGISANDCARDAECLLTKAQVERELGHLVEARELLEAGLDRNPRDDLRMLLLNDLAAVEGLQGRPDTQLRHLQAAHAIFRNSPRADLTDILHHNLAIALARAGQPDRAREVLREAWVSGDHTDLRHVLAVLNNSLYVAREVGDQDWKNEVYEESKRQLERFNSVSPREQLVLDVTQLRMQRNDGIPFESTDYDVLVKRLLDDLDSPQMTIPESDRVAALCEIRHDLEREIQTRYTPTEPTALLELLRRASAQLLGKRAAVDVYLTTLSPKLTGPLDTWHRYRSSIDKAEILLAQSDEAGYRALDRLFLHLREKAEWLAEQGSSLQSVDAWLILCDEYLAYRDQLPVAWSRRYLGLAEHALDQAIELLDACKTQRNCVDQLIGVACFSLRLRNDTSTATRYTMIVKQINPALDHFAIWLREQYQWVLQQVEAQPAD